MTEKRNNRAKFTIVKESVTFWKKERDRDTEREREREDNHIPMQQ